jgi:hypothetical protein
MVTARLVPARPVSALIGHVPGKDHKRNGAGIGKI